MHSTFLNNITVIYNSSVCQFFSMNITEKNMFYHVWSLILLLDEDIHIFPDNIVHNTWCAVYKMQGHKTMPDH